MTILNDQHPKWTPAAELWEDYPGSSSVLVSAPSRPAEETVGQEAPVYVAQPWDNEPLPVPTPPTSVQGAPDPGDNSPLHAVVTLRVAATRDMLAAAADLAAGNFGGDQRIPDRWSVEHTRYLVELTMASVGHADLAEDGASLRALAGPDGDDPSVRDFVQAVYRAIDRAYPPQPSTVTISGFPTQPRTACTKCDWTDGDGEQEQVMSRALDHSALAHGEATA